MSKGCEQAHDFVDYFFQKEGDTYIASLAKTKKEYEVKCDTFLSNANVDNEFLSFRSALLNMEKILPTVNQVGNFDFVKSLASIFYDLELDVSETINVIQKYCEFIQSLNNHWQGLDAEPATVVDTSVQLMATLESMVYPLFLKITDYVGQLCSSRPASAKDKVSPQKLTDLLHKLCEVLGMQIVTIGSSAVVTLGRLPCATKESLQAHGGRLGCQAKSARNCIAWAMKAVAPVLLFYFLQTIESSGGGGKFGQNQRQGDRGACAPNQRQGGQSGGQCQCHIGSVPCATCEQRLQDLTEEGEKRIKKRIAEGEERIRRALEDGESRCRSGDSQSESRSRRKSEEKTKRRSRDAESRREEEERETRKVTTSNKQRKKVEKKEPSEDEESESGSETDVATVKVVTKKNQVTKREEHEIITEKDPNRGEDFVDYFFLKDGQKYIEILTETKAKYEKNCKNALTSADQKLKKDAKDFMATVHNVRKVEPVTKEIEVGDYKFSDDFAHATVGLHINVTDKLTLLHKYNEYTRSMIRHWLYRIEKNLELTPEAVVDGGTQMMATTMALTYPVFMRIGEFLQKLCRNAHASKEKYTALQLAKQCHKLVEINALQMAAIGMSCINVIAKMPTSTKESLKVYSNKIAIQAKFAKNSIAWAMKAISPLLLLYFIKCELPPGSVENQNDHGAEEEMKVPKDGDIIPRPHVRHFEGTPPQSHEKTESQKRNSREKSYDSIPSQPKSPAGDTVAEVNGNAIYEQPAKQHDFVDYFFQRKGETYLNHLTKIRKDYELKCNKALSTVNRNVKEKTRSFLGKIHNARKSAKIKKELEVEDVKFVETISTLFSDVNADIKENIIALCKYYEFTKNMIAHWKYRITHSMELALDAVLEVSIQMMATTVALLYPIFIKIAEYIIMLSKNPHSPRTVSPEMFTERFHTLVELLTTEMAAIGMSCINTMALMPNATKEKISVRSTRLAGQTKYANNSVSWAMKACGPLLLYYFIQYESAVTN